MLFEEVLRDLEADCWAAFSPLFMNRSNNRLSDVLFNPDRTLAEVQANAFSIYYMLRFEAALHIDTQGYEALEKIHERLPEHLLKGYEQLDLLMDPNATIQEHNRRYQDVVYANMEHNIQNHPWWNKGTYAGVPDAEALAWMMGEECKAQTHLVVNSSAHLAGAAERFRTSAIQVYDEIKNILGDTTASPGYMSTHYYPTERTRKMLGTFVLQDSLYFGAAPYKNLSMGNHRRPSDGCVRQRRHVEAEPVRRGRVFSRRSPARGLYGTWRQIGRGQVDHPKRLDLRACLGLSLG